MKNQSEPKTATFWVECTCGVTKQIRYVTEAKETFICPDCNSPWKTLNRGRGYQVHLALRRATQKEGGYLNPSQARKVPKTRNFVRG